jgi:hypothetical protein
MTQSLPGASAFRLKAATRDLIVRAGGLVRAGAVAGRSKSEVHRWGSADHAELIPIAAVLLLEADTQSPLVTRALAEISGFRLEPGGGGGDGAVLDSFVKAVRAEAELSVAVTEAESDGGISPNEARIIAAHADDVQDAVADLKTAAVRAATARKASER